MRSCGKRFYSQAKFGTLRFFPTINADDKFMLDDKDIRELVVAHGPTVNTGRPIKQLIEDGDIPRLQGCTVLEGKVSDSVFGEALVTRSGEPLRLMFRNNRISTHDVNRGAIPFKDQVLAFNHDHMLNLVKDILGTSQFTVPGLAPSSTVIPAENLKLVKLENVLRMYMAESSTSTSLYQHWLVARDAGQDLLNYCLLYTSPSPRDQRGSRMPSSA